MSTEVVWMPDAFESLRRPVVPLAPDPGFTARLRVRLERALTEGDVMTTTTDSSTTAVRRQGTLTPYLAVTPAREAIEWYVEVLGARLVGEPIEMPDGRIGHAELMIGDSLLMLADGSDGIGHTPPSLDAGTHVMFTVQVEDCDAVVDLAAARGARVDRPVEDTEYGYRGGTIRDPFGHRWGVQSALTPPARHGDLVHTSLHLPDVGRGIEFYRTVLGWQLAVDPDGYAAQVERQAMSTGIWSGESPPEIGRPGVLLVWKVSDIAAAGEVVRRLGGTAGQIEERPYGRVLRCVDNQGRGFSLHQDPPGSPTPSPAAQRQGDIEYVTIGVPDSDVAAAFYGELLGWTFAPGSVPGGKQVVGPTPLAGLWGGDANRQPVQLMYRVDDIDAAVERVRRAGGTAAGVEQQPYGRSADCVDDQGLAFFLLQP
jgi:predicted enzyme related to lactoylglutathione lyase